MFFSASKKERVELIKLGELDKVPSGYWAAVVYGKVVAWADDLRDLISIMEKKGYKRNEYAVIKVPPDELLIAYSIALTCLELVALSYQ